MYYTFVGSKLQIVTFALLFFNFQIGLGVNLSTEDFSVERVSEELNTKKYCGSIQISNANRNYEFDVFDREEVNSCLTDIHESETHENFEYLRVQEGCEMKLCVLEFLQPDNPTRKRVCYTFTNDTTLKANGNEYLKYFYVVVVSCSCKKPPLKCRKVKCENVPLKDDECARLYKEPNCQECRYEHKSLTTISDLIPSNSFSVDSFFVKDGCHLDIRSVSELNKPPEFSYEGVHNFSQLSYVQKPNKSEFTCSCGIKDDVMDIGNYQVELSGSHNASTCTIRILGNETSTSEPQSEKIPISDWTNVKIIIAFTIPFAVIIVIVIAYLRTLRNIKKIRDKVASEAIARFQAGESDSVVNYLNQENSNYVSFGYLQALKLPYQKKYEIPRNCLLIDETHELGTGAFGKVLLGRLITSESNDSYTRATFVAVKIAKCSSSINYFVSLLDEIKILAYIGSHPNVVKMIGACTENIKQGDALILLEYCSNGSLKSYLLSNKKAFVNSEDKDNDKISINATGYAVIPTISGNMSYVTIKSEFLWFLNKWAKEILTGMEYLSSIQVVHIDLAVRNILLTDDLVAKICDFGLSRRMHDLKNYVKIGAECPLPFRNMALESLTEYRFSTQSDVWSYGVLLWELFTLGEDPYHNISNHFELINYLRNNKRLQKPAHSSDEMYSTISTNYSEMLRCWASEPDNRPTFTELKTFFVSLPEQEENTRF